MAGSTTTNREVVATNTYSTVIRDRKKINWIHVVYTSTATAGNRQLVIQMLDSSGNVLFDVHAGAVQAASNTYHYSCQQGVYRETSFVDGSLQVPIPADWVFEGNVTLKVYDDTDTDGSDDFVLTYQTEDL
jgi:hypothetical protein